LAYPSSFPAGSRTEVPNPYDEYGIGYEDLYLPTPDGEKLHAYMMLQDYPKTKKTVFFCHANAGNMGHRVPIAAKFYKEFGWNVFIFSYRGYPPIPPLPDFFGGSRRKTDFGG
jgi:abhydrolase domain-containing protein 13